MNSLGVFESYIRQKINEFNEEKHKINNLTIIKNNLDLIINQIKNEKYEEIDFDNMKEVISLIFTPDDINLKINKLKEAISINNLFGGENIPQVQLANNYIQSFNEMLINATRSLELRIYKKKSRVNSLFNEYEEYSELIVNGKILRHFTADELKRFFAFLNGISLDKQIILEITEIFAKDSIEYAEKVKKLSIIRTQRQKDKNAAEISKKVSEKNNEKKEKELPEAEELPVILTYEEKNIYDQILLIVSQLEKNITLTHDALSEIIADDYKLDIREKVYESSEDKFNLILEDLKSNLLPKFKTNKNDIIVIFKYIIDLYNREYQKEKLQFVSRIEDFGSQEKEEIEYYLRLAERELSIYDNLSEVDKNIIHSIFGLIESNEETQISDKFSITYVSCLSMFKKLIDAYREYLEYRDNEHEYFEMGLENDIETDVKPSIVSKMIEIKGIVRRLKNECNLLNEERTIIQQKEADVNEKQGEKPKTLVIFLPLGDGEYCINYDQRAIMEIKKDVMKNIANELHNICMHDFYGYIYSGNANNKNLLPSKGITDYSKEIKPYRMRNGDGRIAYTKLSVSPANQEKLKEAYNLESVDIILVIGCREKIDGSDKAPTEFNRRIAHEIKTIRHIITLFSSDFDTAGLKEATTLIDDSNKICNSLYEEPMKLLDSSKNMEVK